LVTGKTPKSGVPAFDGDDVPFVSPPDFLGHKWIRKTVRNISEAGAQSVKGSLIPPRSVLVTCIGSDMGKAAIAASRCVTNQQINAILVDEHRFCPEFVYYNLSLRKDEIRSLAGGSAQPILNKSAFGQIPLEAPNLEAQREMSAALRPLDDRITLLRETNATLEAIAQALFKSWFVDFDPVRAKMEGRAPEGMDEATAALFPDGFETSELGVVPRGWPQQTFRDTIQIIGGGTPKTSNPDFWGGDIPWFSVVDAPGPADVFVIDTEKHITDAGLHGSSTKLLSAGTTIISARGTVGKLALTGRAMAMNQSCYGLRGKAGDTYFTYFSATRLVQQLQQRAHGSVFDTITQETFSGVHVAYPQATVIQAFDEAVDALMARIRENLFQAQTLSTLRDTLLPRLISGQLRLPEAATLALATP
jgi:type I restriction enzyme S subunit